MEVYIGERETIVGDTHPLGARVPTAIFCSPKVPLKSL